MSPHGWKREANGKNQRKHATLPSLASPWDDFSDALKKKRAQLTLSQFDRKES